MLKITVLGAFEASIDDRPILQSQWQLRSLLAWLVLQADSPQQNATALREVFTDATNDALTHSISRLRKELGDESRRILVEGGRVRFDMKGVWVDAREFEQAIDEATTASLERAVKLYRGPLLKDWEESVKGIWFMELREEFADTYLYALEKLIRSLLAGEDRRRAAKHLFSYIRLKPDHNWGWETLIETELASGNRVEAVRIYQAYIDHLTKRSKQLQTPLHPTAAIEARMRKAQEEAQQRTVEEIRQVQPDPAAAPPRTAARFVATDGAVPIDSPYYIRRGTDTAAMYAQEEEGGYTIRIKGARQTGKSSLLARLLRRERQEGSRVVFTDWGGLTATELQSEESFWRAVAADVARQIPGPLAPAHYFDRQAHGSPRQAFERYLVEQALANPDEPVVWAIDQADRIFDQPFRDDVFRVFRVWHNNRTTADEASWQNLSLILTYSTDASLFIRNLNESPFNVGFVVELEDLTAEQALELNRRHDAPLTATEASDLYRLIDGQPYLWRHSLSLIKTGAVAPKQLLEERAVWDRQFRSHLSGIVLAVEIDADLKAAVLQALSGERVTRTRAAERLLSGGVLVGDFPAPEFRCELYRDCLERRLQ